MLNRIPEQRGPPWKNWGNPKSSKLALGWPKSPYGFSQKIKDTFFIFMNNSIDLDILSMLAISCRGITLIVLRLMSQFAHYQLQLVYTTMGHHPERNLQRKISQTAFDMFDQS